MPGFIAKKLCPHLTIVPLNFEKYGKVSKEVSLKALSNQNLVYLVLDSTNVSVVGKMKSGSSNNKLFSDVALNISQTKHWCFWARR